MKRNKQKGFTLVELLIVVAIILVIVAIAVPSYLASVRATNETAAAGNLRTMMADANTYLGHQHVLPATASAMGGSATITTAAATCAADGELTTAQAAAYDAGFTANGYSFLWKSGGATVTSPLGCAGNTLVEATALPATVSGGSVSYCADQTGEYEQTGIGTAATGAGCGTDGYSIAVQ
jgi:prepilin-type N-terminal cleavage/methylation domain-containing protein